MRPGYTVGIDVGTGSVKAVVYEPGRGIVGRAAMSYPTHTPQAGWAEQDPEQWWRATRAAIPAALADGSVRGSDVGAIAVSGQGAALVLLNARFEPLHSALIHLDQRATAEARALAESDAGRAIKQANGQVGGSWNVAAKYCWFGKHNPAVRQEVSGITSAAGFVLARLTGRLVQSESDAGISDLFDLSTRNWSPPILEALRLEPSQLPEVLPATTAVGPVASSELGLSPRTVVVAGGEDTSSAALSAGVVHRDDAYLSLGTAGVVGVAVARGSVREPRLLTFPHVCDDVDLLSGSMTSAGSALEWWAKITGSQPHTLLEEAESTTPSSSDDRVLFLPYLAGELHPINDPDARGVFSGLSLATSRADLTTAIVEGSATAIADNLDVAMSAGARPSALYATGGPTQSAMWMQAVADATNRRVEVVHAQGAPVGDAILAAAENDDEAAQLALDERTVRAMYQPDEDRAAAAVARRSEARGTYRVLTSLRKTPR